jgi:peroxiredoxin
VDEEREVGMNVGGRWRKVGRFGMVAAAALLLATAWIARTGLRAMEPTTDQSGNPSVLSRTEGSEAAPEVGSRAPDFALFAHDGREYRLSRLRGKKVLLNFLCACSECVELARDWERFHRSAPGTVVLGISTFPPSYLKEFRRATQASFPILFDPSFTVAERYHSMACPRSWVLDEAGRVAYRSNHKAARVVIVTELERVLARTPASIAFANLRRSVVRSACLTHPQYFVNAELAKASAARLKEAGLYVGENVQRGRGAAVLQKP